MAIGTGSSHWEGPLYGSDRAQGGLAEEAPVFVQSQRFRQIYFNDFCRPFEGATGATAEWATPTQLAANGSVSFSNAGLGVLSILSGNVNNDGVGSFQLNYAPVAPSASASADGFFSKRIIEYGIRVFFLMTRVGRHE